MMRLPIVLSELQVYTKNFGDDKISVVSTVADYSTIHRLSGFYFEEKIPELFLRPVNYQGFARKAFNEEAKDLEAWQQAYKSGIEHIFQRNALGSHKRGSHSLFIFRNF